MSKERTFRNAPQVALLASVIAVMECAIAYLWLSGRVSPWLALAAHVAVAILVTLWTFLTASARKDPRLPLLAAISIAALGPFGALGSGVTVFFACRYARRAVPFEEWYRSLLPDTKETENNRILSQVAAAEDREAEAVASFADVLTFGSLSQKQDVIALIGRHFRPAFGPALKRALNDDHSAIRVQAATAMSRIENTLLERTMDLTRQVRANPDDIAALRALAQHYDQSLFCGILDARREEELIADALAVYRECVEREPDDLTTRLAAGRLLLRSKRFEEAVECFAMGGDPGSKKPQVVLWHMESLFQLRRFTEIRRLAHAWASQPDSSIDYPVEATEAVRLWVAGETSPEVS